MTSEPNQWRRSPVFIINFEYIRHPFYSGSENSENSNFPLCESKWTNEISSEKIGKFIVCVSNVDKIIEKCYIEGV